MIHRLMKVTKHYTNRVWMLTPFNIGFLYFGAMNSGNIKLYIKKKETFKN